MALVVPSGALLRIVWAQAGVPAAVNVYGARNRNGVAITQALTNTIGAAIRAAFVVASTGWNNSVGTTITLHQVGLRDINQPNLPEFIDTGTPAAGLATGDLLPLNVSLCVTLRTANAGRSFRGRSYLWGFTETANGATGTANAGLLTSAVTWVTAIQSALNSSNFSLAVVSRSRSIVSDVTSVQVRDAVWDTQRKRSLPGI